MHGWESGDLGFPCGITQTCARSPRSSIWYSPLRREDRTEARQNFLGDRNVLYLESRCVTWAIHLLKQIQTSTCRLCLSLYVNHTSTLKEFFKDGRFSTFSDGRAACCRLIFPQEQLEKMDTLPPHHQNTFKVLESQDLRDQVPDP